MIKHDSTTAHTLLVVDDEPRVLAGLKEVLERQQFHVVTTTDPRRAIDLLQERAFGVIISDHLMPSMSGMDFLVECQRIQPQATRILVTAVLSLPTLVEAINRGEIYRFLAKPWLREELIVTVRNASNRYELLTQNQRLLAESSELNAKLSQANAALATQVATLEQQRRSLDKANLELGRRYDLSLELCSRILATYDPMLAGQTQAVAAIANQMAVSEHFTPEQREALKTSAWLCDLGLIGVSREVYRLFRREPEKLSERELAGIHNHPVYSQTLAAHIDGRPLVGETIRAHHEHFDGSGFPDGLAQQAIPWTARCLAVAVAFVESSLPTDQALEAIAAQSGKELDPEAIRLFRTTTRLQPLPRSVREVMLEDLKAGMVLASGIYSPHGLLLVSEGQPLNVGMIAKIRSHNLMAPISQRLLVYS
ncbi:MAG: response regulator [Opitutus sp.]|nr:response regulator [Opitutus sp.]MCS6248359.1 response regulator [Opitutus sp.]MCS6274804.1 response regulator [Opitutus sp.]MCS6277400.1 response regulator [Opitutus sp.]MCS6300522.1 response regulator [Opitutus sp.]